MDTTVNSAGRPQPPCASRAAQRFCHALDDAQWRTESAAAGWRVQDVVARMGSVCKAIFTPASLVLMRSDDIERDVKITGDEGYAARFPDTINVR